MESSTYCKENIFKRRDQFKGMDAYIFRYKFGKKHVTKYSQKREQRDGVCRLGRRQICDQCNSTFGMSHEQLTWTPLQTQTQIQFQKVFYGRQWHDMYATADFLYATFVAVKISLPCPPDSHGSVAMGQFQEILQEFNWIVLQVVRTIDTQFHCSILFFPHDGETTVS